MLIYLRKYYIHTKLNKWQTRESSVSQPHLCLYSRPSANTCGQADGPYRTDETMDGLVFFFSFSVSVFLIYLFFLQ